MKNLMQTETKPVMQRRYQAVYLHMIGKTIKEIAVTIGRCEPTVSQYIHTYYEKGIEGLAPTKQSGRPSRLTKKQRSALQRVITKETPHDVGFEHVYNWTADLAIQWVEKAFGITFTNSGMLKIFHQMGLSYTRPTYTLAKANPQKQKAFVKKLDAIKKN